MESPFLIILHVVQNYLIMFIGCCMLNIIVKQNQLIRFALINSIIVYCIRSVFLFFNLPIGLHSIFIFFSFFISFKFITNINFKTSAGVILIGMTCVIASEVLFLPKLLKLLNWNVQELISNSLKHIVLGIIDILPLFLLGILIKFKRRRSYEFN